MAQPNPASNVWEHEARGKKLRSLIRQASRLVDHPDDPAVAGLLATTLERWDELHWKQLAITAGVKPPSPLTASLVVAEFRERAKGRVVTIEVGGPAYETDDGHERQDLYILEARVVGETVTWLSAEVHRNEGTTYGDPYPLTLEEAADSRELGG